MQRSDKNSLMLLQNTLFLGVQRNESDDTKLLDLQKEDTFTHETLRHRCSSTLMCSGNVYGCNVNIRKSLETFTPKCGAEHYFFRAEPYQKVLPDCGPDLWSGWTWDSESRIQHDRLHNQLLVPLDDPLWAAAVTASSHSWNSQLTLSLFHVNNRYWKLKVVWLQHKDTKLHDYRYKTRKHPPSVTWC